MIIKTTIPPVSILHQAKEIYREMSSETLPAPVNRHPALLSIMEKTVLLKALSATDRPEKGGAIYSQGTIGKISGNFVGNAVVSQKDTHANGGAVYNDKGSIGQIEGNFIGNYTMASEYNSANGGAVYNEGKIGKINGDFVANKTSTAESYVYGGAIFNLDTIDTINGNFIGNSVSTSGYYSYA